MECLSCYAETSNGLALCALCQRKAEADLEFLPVYFRNLARWRPGRGGSRQTPGSRVLWDGSEKRGDRIADALDETLNSVTTWARTLTDDRDGYLRPLTMADAVLTGDLPNAMAEQLTDDPPLMVAWLCVAFAEHLTSIATLEWCGEFVRELGHHESRLRALTEDAIPGWYAGACRRCGVGTHVVPGLTWVTCGGCGATTYARDHLDVVIDEARDWLASPRRLAEAVVALVDTEQSVRRLSKRIAKWGERDRITGFRRTERTLTIEEDDSAEGYTMVWVDREAGPARHRLGDVLDRILAEGATKTDEVERIEA